MARRPPPAPSADVRAWANNLYMWLVQDAFSKETIEPSPVSLAHRVSSKVDKAVTDGILMYDPVADAPVYSKNGAWVAFGGGGSLGSGTFIFDDGTASATGVFSINDGAA